MALQVHPGTVGATYNSYISIVRADLIHDDRATPEWEAATDDQKSVGLIRATDYIDATFVFTTNPFAGGVVNPLLEKATAMMAVYALTDTLAEKRDEQVIKEKEIKSGDDSIRTVFGASRDPYPMIAAILSPIASSNRGSFVIGQMVK